MEPFLVCPSVIQTRFILIETSHAGNVGAVARAIKVMGFDDLVLVRPRWANVLRREETIQRASGALDVLNNARIVGTLDEALEGMTHLCATAMTARDFGPPTLTPRTHLESFIEEIRTTDALVRDGDNSPQNPHGSQAESESRASPSPSPSPSQARSDIDMLRQSSPVLRRSLPTGGQQGCGVGCPQQRTAQFGIQ